MNAIIQDDDGVNAVFKADITALNFIVTVHREAIRQLQRQLLILRRANLPNTNMYAIRSLLTACRRERLCIATSLDMIAFQESLLDEKAGRDAAIENGTFFEWLGWEPCDQSNGLGEYVK
ncbi:MULTISPECIES: hypothetical protein [Aeromonas]|uniref:hypothetical protein n=1 Tax=Aeromonas TaxID=642 RepID=UPI0019804BC9|nr:MULTISPECIES: hypothetical protein [Aeromonas]MBW3733387.1 hypothetical protein [Aeromonas dhakensis]QSR54559.1 hypothetical protein GO601_03400 [Aeromonas dhakensis]